MLIRSEANHATCTFLSANVIGSTYRELYANGTIESGVYVVNAGVRAYCSMGFLNCGWTVVARKMNYSNEFMENKYYKDFTDGFGDFPGSYFLGLDTLHEMTSTHMHEAYFEMEYSKELIPFAFAQYSSFAVGDRSSGYQLSLGSYVHTVPGHLFWVPGGDGLGVHHGASFHAMDSSDSSCGRDYSGRDYSGWWYNRCDHPSYQACNYNRWFIFPHEEIANFVFAIREI